MVNPAPMRLPVRPEDWWEAADELEDLAERIRDAVETEQGNPAIVQRLRLTDATRLMIKLALQESGRYPAAAGRAR